MTVPDLRSHESLGARRDQCFFCGYTFAPENLTREHVFPKWLQRKLDLWNRELILLNGTSIQYRHLTTPACTPCNGVILSKLESEMAESIRGGAYKVRSLGYDRLFVWIAKIFFGILYAETLLPVNRADRSGRRILSGQVLAGFRHLHFLMQAARSTLEFHSTDTKYHTSILVFPVQQHPNPEFRFMYRDDLEYGCVAIRLDTLGLIYVSDGGVQEKVVMETMPEILKHNLHPLQFEELTALIFVKSRGFNRNPAQIITSANGRVQILQMPIAGLSSKPVFDDFDTATYEGMLAQFTGYPLSMIASRPGRVMSWIGDLHRPRQLDVRDHPWP